MILDSLRIQNLRSLADTKKLELRPINILVGTNSSGKSTFLRTFPLLRQSVETATTGPILWYGRYVDFGTFAQAARRNSNSQEVTFEFGLTIEKNFDVEHYRYPLYRRPGLNILDNINISLALSLAQSPRDGKTIARQIKLGFPDEIVTINASEGGTTLEFDLKEFDTSLSAKSLRFSPSENLLPQIVLKPEFGLKKSQQIRRYPWWSPFEDELLKAIRPLFSKNTNSSRCLEAAYSIGIGTAKTQFNQLRRLATGTGIFSKRVAKLQESDHTFKQLQKAILLNSLPQILTEIDRSLANYFKTVRYIAPVRATAERYYRQQDLAVDEIDPQGANLAMFLQSLSESEKDEFSNWCEGQLGFSVRAKTEGAHISLVLRDTMSKAEYNIADMGFGFSQILPVLAQIWSLIGTNRPRQPGATSLQRFNRDFFGSRQFGDIIAIEQPELHLHPRLQARVADMIVMSVVSAKRTKRPLTVIFETHSETIINRIGHLVANERIAPKDVQILLFEKETAESDTEVKRVRFRADGVLENWPMGFFLAAAD